VIQLWPEDFSTCSLEEIFSTQAENRAWNKELRFKNTDLVNRRLAQSIDQAEYACARTLGQEYAAECRRRATVLMNEIASRMRHEVPIGQERRA
jgi:hypothetical protein